MAAKAFSSPPEATRRRVGIIFGGRSVEHEISLVSARAIVANLPADKYEVLLLGITPAGNWVVGEEARQLLMGRLPERYANPGEDGKAETPKAEGSESTLLCPGNGKLAICHENSVALKNLDVIFPVLHGPCGEGGAIQGMLEWARVPYVGTGILGSALAMDKSVAKKLLRAAGLPVVRHLVFWSRAVRDAARRRWLIARVERSLSYPVFVKPANLGSSLGIASAARREELEQGLLRAAEYDRKVMVEEAVVGAREIECAVLGNEISAQVSVLGEVVSNNAFCDYHAKDVGGKLQTIIPAPLPREVAETIRGMALTAFRALECHGMARVDFLLRRADNAVFVSSVNTIPDFSAASMYPRLWEASGLPFPQLLERLLGLALERGRERNRLRTRHVPQKNWYRLSEASGEGK
jgi:D-alanine-D-alanine ligase